jgi:hypothetical protein
MAHAQGATSLRRGHEKLTLCGPQAQIGCSVDLTENCFELAPERIQGQCHFLFEMADKFWRRLYSPLQLPVCSCPREFLGMPTSY